MGKPEKQVAYVSPREELPPGCEAGVWVNGSRRWWKLFWLWRFGTPPRRRLLFWTATATEAEMRYRVVKVGPAVLQWWTIHRPWKTRMVG